jgi:hypothetical protein
MATWLPSDVCVQHDAHGFALKCGATFSPAVNWKRRLRGLRRLASPAWLH